MLPRADLTGTRPTAAIERTAPAADSVNARTDTSNRLTQIALGRQVQATVLSRFNDGSFLVRVADTGARMNLPQGYKVGDTLNMTMLAHVPRPTFLLTGEAGSATATLSSAGRLIDALLHMNPGDGAKAVTGKTPLLPAAVLQPGSAASALLAGSMQSAVGSSGLFYESHLQEWLSGARTTAELAHEPQAALARELAAPGVQPHAGALQLLRQMHGDPDNSDKDAAAAAPQDAANPLTDADLIATPVKPETLSRESMEMIRMQLHTLEQRQFAWQGELFPGVPLHWEVGEDTPPAAHAETERRWNSTVRFDLPNLGTVAATISLCGEHVQIRVATQSDQASAVLRESGGMLASALEAAGTRLDTLLVKQDDQA